MRTLYLSLCLCFLCSAAVTSAGCKREQIEPTNSTAAELAAESAELLSSAAGRDETPVVPELVAEADPPPDKDVLRDAGLEALIAGETDAAYGFARQAMRIDANDPQVIFLMARVLAERHRFPEAIAMLEEVAQTTPEARLPVMGQTAEWLVRYGRWAEAEARYLEILQQIPDAVLVHRNLASLLMRQGRRVEAVAHLHRLCRLGDVTENELRSILIVAHPLTGDAEEKSFDPIGVLGLARNDVAKGDWQAARERLQQMKSPGPWELALLGRASAESGDLDSLRIWIKDVDASIDVSPDAWFAKGMLAASAKQHAVATRCFSEAVLLDPTDHEAYAKLELSLTATNSTKEAAAAGQRAKVIEKTQVIGQQMAAATDRDERSILQLVDLLQQLRRPLEALAWRGARLMYVDTSSPGSDEEAQKVLDEIVHERANLLSGGTDPALAEFLLCGVNLDILPSRDEVNRILKLPADDVTD